ncbi:hypothetical protein [Niabella hibiscisoli]|uniref:hypothetical protein n=1 Tax=Niabella hibiscisoli TaxID=1825928 RepID=UPI001F0F6CB6|nr:hypothetical protein [Niabella hibiscisoli]MCH5721133.1 hypothetical protein [Niabella hibiscisoli]
MGVDVSNLRNNNKAFLTYGYETRQNNEWLLKYRHFLSSALTLNINALTGVNALYTDDVLFDNRNYEIDRNNGELLLSYIKGTSFRITTGYKREHKKMQVYMVVKHRCLMRSQPKPSIIFCKAPLLPVSLPITG